MNLATYRVTIGQPGGEKTESITLNPTELELTKGNSRTIQATVEPRALSRPLKRASA